VLARIQHIMDSPRYKELSPERQAQLRSNYYDQTVKPAYEGSHLKAPEKDVWVSKIADPNMKMTPADYYNIGPKMLTANRAITAAMQGGVETFAGMAHGGVWVGQQAALATLGLTNFFTGPALDMEAAGVNQLKKRADDIIDRVSQDYINTSKVWDQTHPSQHWQETVGSYAGNIIGTLPLYEITGMARGAMAESAVLNKMGMGSLTKVLESSPKGKFVQKRLMEAADGIISTTIQGKDNQEKLTTALSFMGFGAASAAVGHSVLASNSLMKGFAAKIMAMGGRPLVAATANEAVHELESATINGVKAETAEEATSAMKAAHENDPVKSSLVTAQKISFISLAKKAYGPETVWKNLSPSRKAAIRLAHTSMTEDALAELPLHVPDIAKANIQATISEEAKTGTPFAFNLDKLKKELGVDVVAIAQQNEQESLAKLTGAQSSQGSARRAAKKPVVPQVAPEIKKKSQEGYASFKVNSLAYFTNPVPKGVTASESKKFNWAGWLEDMSSEDFIHELRDNIMSAGQHFEDPEHMLLWANKHRDQMPKPFAQRIKQELNDLNPHATDAFRREQADVLEAHMADMAYTGHLDSDGNIFRSTNANDWLSPTAWQKQLREEAEQLELEHFAQAYSAYPEQVAVQSAMLKKLQKLRTSTKGDNTPARYLDLSEKIRNSVLKPRRRR